MQTNTTHTMWIFAAVFVLLTVGLRAETYDNTLGGKLLRVCPRNQVVSRVKSSHKSSDNDRQWKFDCKTLDTKTQCSWSGFHNVNETKLSYNCPANNVISAVVSFYENGVRRWNFFCCSAQNLITFECQDTPPINNFNEGFDWHVPEDTFLTGIHTHGKNNDGDHRWSFSYCRGTQEPQSKTIISNQQSSRYFAEGGTVLPRTSTAEVCSNCRWSTLSHMMQVQYTMNNSSNSGARSIIGDPIQAFHLSTCVSTTAFSKDGKNTITALTPPLQIGQMITMPDTNILNDKLYNATNYLYEYDEWDNELAGVLSRQCPSGQAVAGITSIHNEDGNDRLFGISCKAFTASMSCQWSSYVNNYWEDLNFTCPDDHVITGVYSKYHRILQDRRWKFNCCKASGFAVFNCKTTPKINNWHEYLNWKVASSNFLTGVRSYFDNKALDHQWSFSYCQRKSEMY